MKYTNNEKLPSAIVNACMEDDGHEPKDGVYHVTELIKPTKMAALQRRHHDEIVQDVSDCVWLVFGKAVHSLLEKHDDTGYSEYELSVELENGCTVVGRCDLYNEEECAIEDYKTASVWKVIGNDFSEWRLQGIQYAYMMQLNGKLVKKLRFHAFLKDWTAREFRLSSLQGKYYPPKPIYTWEYEVSSADIEEAHRFMIERSSAEHGAIALDSDDEIPCCTPEERWNSGNRFAVMKPGRKTALKLFDSEDEAIAFSNQNQGTYIEKRTGEDKRCRDYCLGHEFCSYWKENVKEK